MWIYVVVLLTIIIVILSFKIKTKNKSNEKHNNVNIIKENINYPSIQIIENPSIIPSEKNKITNYEINKAISTIDNILPKAVMAGQNLNVAKEILNNKRTFFSTSKSDATKMMNVKNSSNKFYGTQKTGNKFSKQTVFKNEEMQMKAYGKNALTNAGLNAATMVVGQYYMSEINDKLQEMNLIIKDILNYHKSEYQSEVLFIVSKLEEIINNQNEILLNEESRKNAYNDNKKIEEDCAKLLGQANINIKNELSSYSLEYKKYEEGTGKIYEWYVYQQLLQELLLKICDMRYVLANGTESSKYSHNQYNNYLIQTNETNTELQKWHESYIEKFGVDIEKQRKKAKLFKLREHTIGLLNEEWNYNKIQNDFSKQIAMQVQPKEFEAYEKIKQNDYITILKHNGEYYNLPKGDNE